MKAVLTDKEIWERFKEIVSEKEILTERIYQIRLTDLGRLIFENADENDLKGLNQRLACVLRRHQIRVIMRGGRRYVLIPERLLRELEAPKKRKTELLP